MTDRDWSQFKVIMGISILCFVGFVTFTFINDIEPTEDRGEQYHKWLMSEKNQPFEITINGVHAKTNCINFVSYYILQKKYKQGHINIQINGNVIANDDFIGNRDMVKEACSDNNHIKVSFR